ncbi:MAG: DUF6069 family protein [Candidatus Dormibacteraceae bacterium]
MAQFIIRSVGAQGRFESGAWRRLVLATAISALAGAAVSGLAFGAASAAALVDRHVILPSLMGMGPLSLASVSVTAAVAAAGSGVLFGALSLATRHPVRNYRVTATALAILSLPMPATIPGPPVPMRITMLSMHVIVWAIAVGVLPALARQSERDSR